MTFSIRLWLFVRSLILLQFYVSQVLARYIAIKPEGVSPVQIVESRPMVPQINQPNNNERYRIERPSLYIPYNILINPQTGVNTNPIVSTPERVVQIPVGEIINFGGS